MRDGLLRRDPRLGLRIVEPLQPRVRIVEPPPVQRVAAIRIAARHGEFEGRVQILHQVVEEYRALERRDLTCIPGHLYDQEYASRSERSFISVPAAGSP